MASRNRHSTARPGPSRSSVAPTPLRAPLPTADELPPYKKPSHPLNTRAQDQLRALNGRTIAHLKDHNKKAGNKTIEAAGLINDKLRERSEQLEKRRKRLEKDGREKELAEEERKLADLQKKVDDATAQLEESMRSVIDGGIATQRIEESLEWLRQHAPGQLEREYATQRSQQQSQRASQMQRRRRRTPNEDEDEDMEEDDEEQEDEGPTPGPTPLDGSRPVLTGTAELFTDRMTRKKNEYTSISLTTRYAKHNDYIGFKKLVHDARFQDDRPLPHPDTWFTDSGSPAPGITNARGDEDDDDDIVMDRATISTRCPLTFQQFKEPYTSVKCPHTFEKSVILDMIRKSNTRVGGGQGRGAGIRAVECPVAGCSQMLTEPDLHHDPVLVRKIKRMQQAEAQEAEDSEPEDEAPARRNLKAESSLQVPSTQQPPRSSIVEDLGDPSDDEDEEV